jgi:FkbM family methyltransferase
MASLNRALRAFSRLPSYLAWLAGSRHSKDAGWYSMCGDARLARSSFLHGSSMTCYISPTGVRIPLEGPDDLDTTFDVYSSGHYDRLGETMQPGSVVWDIGANIGVASLIFAQNPNVDHVYAYEPMPHTFACARESFAANAALAGKIDIENMGVSSSRGELELNYTEKAKCAIGVSEIPDRLRKLYDIRPEDMKSVTVQLADAEEVLRGIRARHPNAPIVLKLDAEGAEYGIIDRLASTGALREISAAAIEWHLSPGEPVLTSRLRDAGFQTEAKVLEADGSIGMIDAWR